MLSLALCVLVLFTGSFCSPDAHVAGDEFGVGFKKDITINDIHGELKLIAVKMKGLLDYKLGELRDITETVNGAKLDKIIELLETIRRTQRFIMICNKNAGKCGEHGTCDLSDDEATYQCQCQEGYTGEHCEITGPCVVDLHQSQQLPPMPGRELPNCAEDGSYAAIQYAGSMAVCVTEGNDVIHGYSTERWNIGDMDCQCARDEVTRGEVLSCLPNGNYQPIACDTEQCWCQDLQGNALEGSVPKVEMNSLVCS